MENSGIMKRIRRALKKADTKLSFNDDGYAMVEFWTDTAGQNIVVELVTDKTAKDFVTKFTEYAESYNVDNEVAVYAGSLGKNGVPDHVADLLADCEEAKEKLMEISDALQKILDESEGE